MGVRGLASYIRSQPALGNRVDVKSGADLKTKFFIDGNAYVHHLYMTSDLDWIHGGQYTEFADLFVSHLKQMQAAGIDLKIYFDGPLHDRKEQTRFLRHRGNIDRINNVLKNMTWLAQNTKSTKTNRSTSVSQQLFVMPLLALDACVHAIRHNSIDFEFCDDEADGVIARQAKENGGFVISRDSDFFVYNLGAAGYIPIDTLTINPDGLTALAYRSDKIASHFGLEPKYMPVFASILGNDYLPPDLFMSSIKADYGLGGKIPKNWFKRTAAYINHHAEGSSSTDQLLSRIITSVSNLPEDLTAQQILEALHESIRQYDPDSEINFTSSSPSEHIQIDEAIWNTIHEQYRHGKYCYKIMDVVMRDRNFWCTPFMEDLDRESSWVISRQLRQWMYSIVLGSSSKEFVPLEVTEYVRHANHLGNDIVQTIPLSELGSIAHIPSLSHSNLSSPDMALKLYLQLHRCESNHLDRSLHPTILSIIAILRYLIHHAAIPVGAHKVVHKFSNHEIVAIIISTVLSLSPTLWPKQPPPPSSTPSSSLPTRRGLQIAAQLQTTLLSSYLLAQALNLGEHLFPTPTLAQYFNGQSLHHYLRNAKGGATIERMVGKQSLEISSMCYKVLELVMAGWNKDEVNIVFQYADNGNGRKKSPDRGKKGSSNKKKQKVTESSADNMFNVLSSGCRW
ncbi:PIN domain-like protein [Umbelopsis sp. AD052]|nr:PIN domain-like protein [Umbelopsis sp. AD052]